MCQLTFKNALPKIEAPYNSELLFPGDMLASSETCSVPVLMVLILIMTASIS